MIETDIPRVFFILVNYNGDKDTIDCIDSINSMITYENYGIIVVDNSPGLESYNILENNNLKNTILIRSNTNNGFAAGCNIGIKKAEEIGYDYVILLNNDTIIKTQDLVEQLLMGFGQYNNTGICGGKIYYYDSPNDSWYAAGYLTKIRLRAKNRESLEGILETPFITGCLQMISKEILNKVGLLSEEYFMLYEDADYCKRIQIAGYKTVYNSQAQIFHKVSKSMPSSSPDSIFNSNRARFIYINKFHKYGIQIYIFYLELCLKFIIYRNEKKRAVKDVFKWIRINKQ